MRLPRTLLHSTSAAVLSGALVVSAGPAWAVDDSLAQPATATTEESAAEKPAPPRIARTIEEAVSRDLGLTLEEFSQQAADAAKLARFAAENAEQFRRAFGGVWMDEEGRPTVGIARTKRSALGSSEAQDLTDKAEESGFQVSKVTKSQYELDSQANMIDNLLSGLDPNLKKLISVVSPRYDTSEVDVQTVPYVGQENNLSFLGPLANIIDGLALLNGSSTATGSILDGLGKLEKNNPSPVSTTPTSSSLTPVRSATSSLSSMPNSTTLTPIAPQSKKPIASSSVAPAPTKTVTSTVVVKTTEKVAPPKSQLTPVKKATSSARKLTPIRPAKVNTAEKTLTPIRPAGAAVKPRVLTPIRPAGAAAQSHTLTPIAPAAAERKMTAIIPSPATRRTVIKSQDNTAVSSPTSEVVKTAPAIIGGTAFDTGGESGVQCSTGFNGLFNDKIVNVTAAHCNESGEDGASAYLIDGEKIGEFDRTRLDDVDTALITIDEDIAARFNNNLVAAGEKPRAITGTMDVVPGQVACLSGSRTGYSCGKITNVGRAIEVGVTRTIRDGFTMDICALPGDSGGVIFAGTQAVGIASASNAADFDSCSEAEKTATNPADKPRLSGVPVSQILAAHPGLKLNFGQPAAAEVAKTSTSTPSGD